MNKLVVAFARCVDVLTQISAALAATGLAMIVASYVYEVISRYFFASPTAWASDFVSYALCAIIFLALPRVTREKAHVAVTILVDVAPKRAANITYSAANVLGFLCLTGAAWISLQENIRQFTRGIETLAIVPIPQWWVSSFITFGLALSACHLLLYVHPKHRISGLDVYEGTN